MTRAFAVQRVAVPVAHRSARTFDDRYQRGEVVKLEPRFDHEVDMPAREQAVVVAVAAEEHPLVRCLRRERHEMLAVMVAAILRAGGGENGIGQVAAGPRRPGRGVVLGWTPRPADPPVPPTRLAACSDKRPT